jgi:hypothetical protein
VIVNSNHNKYYSDIIDHSVANGYIGHFGHITKGLCNLQVIMPSHYSSLTVKALIGNYVIRIPINISLPAISIVNNEYENIYHFMYESLVKLFCLRGYLEKSTLIFPTRRQKYHDEWFKILGVEKIQFIEIGQIVKTPLAISCTFLNKSMLCHDKLLIDFRDWLIKNLSSKNLIDSSSTFPQKIFINRSRAKYRKIVNFEEVELLLIEFGYKIIDLEDYTLTEQINYFINAKDIIGIHGAGFAHLCFTKAKILDVIVNEFNVTFFSDLAKVYKIEYNYLRSLGVPNNYPRKSPGYLDIFINVAELREELLKR